MILGVIPARAGSKRIPGKNIIDLCGKPLIEYTIEAANNSQMLDGILISTDIPDVLLKYNATLRPQELCTDDSSTLELLKYLFSQYNYSHICLLQPTSPLRTSQDIDEAIIECMLQDKDSLYSGYKIPIKTKNKIYNKKTSGTHFQRNGAIFITSRNLVNKNKIWSKDVIEYEMPSLRSIDIDTYEDLFIAESLIKNGVLEK